VLAVGGVDAPLDSGGGEHSGVPSGWLNTASLPLTPGSSVLWLHTKQDARARERLPGHGVTSSAAMRQDDRAPFVQALQRARVSAYAPGEFVEQEGFMRAGEIRALAGRAGVAPGVSVLDLCCGVAGPGRFITQELGCSYLGVDLSSGAIAIARSRARARDLPCRFEVSRIPPIPPGPFDVVLLLETMLAFRDKQALLREISRTLTTGGRFAFTMEEGRPLTDWERARMPDADTVWLTPLAEMLTLLEHVGLAVRWQDDCSRSHGAVADSLIDAFGADKADIAAGIGPRALAELLAAHRLWSDWLREGRVRKLAFVAEKTETPTSRYAARSAADSPAAAPLNGARWTGS
jgi:SAM-dependent methyltransferase